MYIKATNLNNMVFNKQTKFLILICELRFRHNQQFSAHLINYHFVVVAAVAFDAVFVISVAIAAFVMANFSRP
jgi:hypothetical protein